MARHGASLVDVFEADDVRERLVHRPVSRLEPQLFFQGAVDAEEAPLGPVVVYQNRWLKLAYFLRCGFLAGVFAGLPLFVIDRASPAGGFFLY